MFNKKGSVSLLELLILFVLGIELIFILLNAFGWLSNKFSKGSDSFTLNTCETVAKINSSNGIDCPVNGCSGGYCTHKEGSSYVGYYDNVKNTIVADKVKGYNYKDNPTVAGKEFKGLSKTMIIKVTTGNGQIKYEWVSAND